MDETEEVATREQGMAHAEALLKNAVAEATKDREPVKAEWVEMKSDARKETTALAPVDWQRSLEPQSLSQAMNLAKAIKASHLFDSYGSAEAVLMTIMAGRSLGIDTMTALRTFHIVEGRPTMSAALMHALVLRSDSCKQFEFVERSKERATVRVWRKGWEKPQDVTYSVEDARLAGKLKVTPPSTDGKDRRGMWEKDPAAMCVARCQAIGARLGWPDLLANMYTEDEVSQ